MTENIFRRSPPALKTALTIGLNGSFATERCPMNWIFSPLLILFLVALPIQAALGASAKVSGELGAIEVVSSLFALMMGACADFSSVLTVKLILDCRAGEEVVRRETCD